DKLSSSDAAFAKSKAKGNGRKKKTKSLTKSLDQLNAEVARLFTALNQATILEAEKDEEILRLRASPLEFVSFFRGQFQGLVQKFLASDEFSRVQGELLSLAASVGFERGLGMNWTLEEFAEVLKKTSRFVPGAQDRLPEASPLVSQTEYAFLNTIADHAMDPVSVILQLELEKLARPASVPTLRDTRVSPFLTKESTVTPVCSSLELLSNTIPSSSATLLEPNEEWGASHVVDGNAELTLVRSERVSSGPNDVVVALSSVEKGDGSLPSSVADEEVAATPSEV
ncbi:hypothetical protein Tco_1552072, partial [Tanacetum coccineum]